MGPLELASHILVALFAAVFAVMGSVAVHLSREQAQANKPAMPFVVAGAAFYAVALFLVRLGV